MNLVFHILYYNTIYKNPLEENFLTKKANTDTVPGTINVIIKFQYDKLRKNVISRISEIFMKIEKSEWFLLLNFWLIFNSARWSKFNSFWFYNSISIRIFLPEYSNWEFQIEFGNKIDVIPVLRNLYFCIDDSYCD